MLLPFQITQAGIVIAGILVAVAAILGAFGEVVIVVINYLLKLFAGPVKTEPFSHKSNSARKS